MAYEGQVEETGTKVLGTHGEAVRDPGYDTRITAGILAAREAAQERRASEASCADVPEPWGGD